MPGIPTIDAVGLDQDISFFAHVCNVWVPVLGSFDRELEKVHDHVSKGGQAWFYTCIAPQGTAPEPLYRSFPAQGQASPLVQLPPRIHRLPPLGRQLWGPQPLNNVQTVINDNRTLLPAGDNALVYPNRERNSVLSSIRLEAMRDGIEDYELLTVFARNRTVEARTLVSEVIPHVTDYIRDPQAFRKYHRRLLESLE